jgi:hypothetical protein
MPSGVYDMLDFRRNTYHGSGKQRHYYYHDSVKIRRKCYIPEVVKIRLNQHEYKR